jgi:hypothetical protein
MQTGMHETRTDPSVFRTDCLFSYFCSCIQVNRVTRPCTPFYGAQRANKWLPWSISLSLEDGVPHFHLLLWRHATQLRSLQMTRLHCRRTVWQQFTYRFDSRADSRLFVVAEAVRKDLEGIDRGPIWLLGGTAANNAQHFNPDSLYLNRDSNSSPPGYKQEAIPIEPNCSVNPVSFKILANLSFKDTVIHTTKLENVVKKAS